MAVAVSTDISAEQSVRWSWDENSPVPPTDSSDMTDNVSRELVGDLVDGLRFETANSGALGPHH